MGWLRYFIASACVSVVVFFGVGSYLLWTISQSEKRLETQAGVVLIHLDRSLTEFDAQVSQLGPTLTNVAGSVSQTEVDVSKVAHTMSGVASGIQQTIKLVNDPCVPGPCGTIADVNKTLNTVRGTFGQIEIAANHEDKNLTKLDNQEQQLFDDSHQALTNFNSLLTSKDLADSIHNGSVVSQNMGDMTTDAKNKFHEFLYPTPCTGKKCIFIHLFSDAKILGSLAEPTYYLDRLLSNR